MEVALNLFIYLIGKTESRVVHCQQESLNLKTRIEFGLDNLDGIEQLAYSFEGKILTLYGNDDRICGRQSMSM